MVRTPSFDKNGIKKGAWSPEEDAKLKAYISHYGHWNWRELPKFAGLKRCGKSCRLRWMNYLRPDLKHGNYTVEEDQLIIQLHQQHGNKWAEIASKLPGRSDNDIKNHWHTHLKKLAGFKKPTANNVSKIHKPILNDQISASHIEILESCPVTSSAANCVTTSSEVGTSISSTMDDWGLDEMMNSDDLFAEMSSLLSPINQHDERKFGVQLESPVNAMLYDYGEVDQDDLWSEALLVSDKYDEVLFSPSLNYYQENDFNLFFDETM